MFDLTKLGISKGPWEIRRDEEADSRIVAGDGSGSGFGFGDG